MMFLTKSLVISKVTSGSSEQVIIQISGCMHISFCLILISSLTAHNAGRKMVFFKFGVPQKPFWPFLFQSSLPLTWGAAVFSTWASVSSSPAVFPSPVSLSGASLVSNREALSTRRQATCSLGLLWINSVRPCWYSILATSLIWESITKEYKRNIFLIKKICLFFQDAVHFKQL